MIQLSHSPLPFAALSEPGLVRQKNEDRFSVSAFKSSLPPYQANLLAVLCDGVGGEQAGEVAAEMGVNLITGAVARSNGVNPTLILQEAIQEAGAEIRRKAESSQDLRGMASTTACAWIVGHKLYTATVGDSRIYLLRNETIDQLSIDHTWLQEALDSGMIPPGDNENHPNAHVIRRFLGSENPALADLRIQFEGKVVDNQGFDLVPGDIIFLCTDGCTDLVTAEEIRQKLPGTSLREGLESIKALAYERGGRDNISMVAIQIPTPGLGAARARRVIRLVLFSVAILLAAAIGIYFGWRSQREHILQPVNGFTPQVISSTAVATISPPLGTPTIDTSINPYPSSDLPKR